jgi:HTH-type transcriptional regulator/antitoxin HigA
MMDVRTFKTEADQDWALREIEQYSARETATGSDAAARFEAISTLIEAYEEKHRSISSMSDSQS